MFAYEGIRHLRSPYLRYQNIQQSFKRNMSVYTWFLSNSVSKADIDKSDDEIIASIDLNVINKRYTSEDEDNQTTIGKVQNDTKRIFLHSERGL